MSNQNMRFRFSIFSMRVSRSSDFSRFRTSGPVENKAARLGEKAIKVRGEVLLVGYARLSLVSLSFI